MLPTYRAWNHPKAIPSPPFSAVCRRPTGAETTTKHASTTILGCLYVANLQVYKVWNHPKTIQSPSYWAVCRRLTGPGTTPKPCIHQYTLLGCLYVANLQPTGPETIPKQFHPHHTGLYVADHRAWNHPKATPFSPYWTVYRQTPNPLLPQYWAVRRRPAEPDTTPKRRIHHDTRLSVCCQSTGLYVANLQGLKPPQSTGLYVADLQCLKLPSHSSSSILGCMSPTYRAWNHPKPIPSPPYWAVCCQPTRPETTPNYWAVCRRPQGLKPPQSQSQRSLKTPPAPAYWAVCHQPTEPETTPKHNKGCNVSTKKMWTCGFVWRNDTL